MNDILTYVPKLSKHLKVYPFGKHEYMIHQTEYDRRMKVSELVKDLLEEVDGERDIQTIRASLENNYGLEKTHEELYELFHNQLGKIGVTISDHEVSPINPFDYMSIRFTLFKPATIRKVSHIFAPFFEPKLFFTSSILMLGFSLLLIFFYFDKEAIYDSISIKALVVTQVISILSLFFHELGHATACRKFGAEHGEIGFGFYMLSPMLYADVSDAWKLSVLKRTIINLGGFYMQIIMCTILGILFLLTLDYFYLLPIYLIILIILVNLNPLFRYDGYWILSDLINVPNLRRKSFRKLSETIRYIYKPEAKLTLKSRLDFFLLGYGALCFGFLIFFLGAFVLYNPQSVLYFPVHLLEFFKSLFIVDELSFPWLKSELVKLGPALIFYFIIFKLFFKRGLIALKELIKI